jgi:hypothetical protein
LTKFKWRGPRKTKKKYLPYDLTPRVEGGKEVHKSDQSDVHQIFFLWGPRELNKQRKEVSGRKMEDRGGGGRMESKKERNVRKNRKLG